MRANKGQDTVVPLKHVCPWWLAYTFDNPLRRIFHNPEKIFAPYLHAGMTAVDLGCGMGYFSIGMARMVGETGKVIAVDLQQRMLDILLARARKGGVANRITPFSCEENNVGPHAEVDFALAFWMAHNTPDEFSFLQQVYALLKKSGTLLLAEPKMHVTAVEFDKTVALAQKAGFKHLASPMIALSHAALFAKSSQ
jgi:ubiquinone/menaquinone biosynthesis C-methylase UbiE